ncbi:MAG TPA: hypothetical protein VMG82_09975 [Candidatus Sulfotelmatobacter sp.]|nr:hypothetical protein [Candidatus Sulfotelmatobacter sp.]
MGELQFVSPTDGTTFDIAPGTAVTGPQMPVIQAEVCFTGLDPDPTATATFQWVVSIEFQCSDCRNGRAREINDQFGFTTIGGKAAINFPRVRGGQLAIAASVDLPAQSFSVQSNGLHIRGVNPPHDEVNAACQKQIVQQIAMHESGCRQFNAPRDGGVSECPLFSGDRLGGVGLFQITNPPPAPEDHWDWLANVNHGLQILAQKRTSASNYPARVRNSAAFQALVQQLNVGRNPPSDIVLPDFTPEQLDLDAARGYNGWAGHDAFGNVLHEFRVPCDDAGNLMVNVGPDNRGVIEWEQVPGADRPQNTGDPNYVAHVVAQQP